jgi:hypothetical protein
MTQMYVRTPAQVEAEKKLNKEGFEFLDWIDIHDPYEEDTSKGCMVFTRHPGPGRTEYREVDPDGIVPLK